MGRDEVVGRVVVELWSKASMLRLELPRVDGINGALECKNEI